VVDGVVVVLAAGDCLSFDGIAGWGLTSKGGVLVTATFELMRDRGSVNGEMRREGEVCA
jgi:hypothetical protein